MCSDIGKRDHYALLINPSAEPRHLEKTEMSLAVLSAAGYETFVVSPEVPAQPVDAYVTPTIDDIVILIKGLKKKIDGDDELAIYRTGHGSIPGKTAPLCLGKKCYDVSKLLDGIEHGQRVVVMDQCYSGNWGKFFLDDPATLFISAGSPGEKVSSEFPYSFWSQSVVDGSDGIDWQGRFEYAMESGIYYSLPQFIPSPGFVQTGVPPFEVGVTDVANKKALNEALSELKPGQYAAVLFSDDQSDVSTFDEPAEASGGQHLWIRTDNEKLAKAYGVKTFPTAMIVDSNGHTNIVSDGMAVEEGIAQFHLTPEEVAMEEIAEVAAIDDPVELSSTLGVLADWLAKRELGEAAPQVFDELVRIANGLKDKELRAETLQDVAHGLAQAGFEKKAVSVFKKSIQIARGIKPTWFRDVELRIIITSTDYSVFGEEALAAIEISMAAARKIDDEDEFALIEEKISLYLAETDLIV